MWSYSNGYRKRNDVKIRKKLNLRIAEKHWENIGNAECFQSRVSVCWVFSDSWFVLWFGWLCGEVWNGVMLVMLRPNVPETVVLFAWEIFWYWWLCCLFKNKRDILSKLSIRSGVSLITVSSIENQFFDLEFSYWTMD